MRPAWPPSGRRVEQTPADDRADRRRGPQDAEAHRPDVQDRLAKTRQQRHRASEEHCEEVERDRAQQHRRAADEVRAPRAPCRAPGTASAARGRRGRADRERRTGPARNSRPPRSVDSAGRDREQQAADRGPRDDGDLEGDRSQGHRARDQLGRHQRGRQRPRRRRPIAPRHRSRRRARGKARAACRPPADDRRPQRNAMSIASGTANMSRRDTRSASWPAATRARQRDELRQPDQPEVERVAGRCS